MFSWGGELYPPIPQKKNPPKKTFQCHILPLLWKTYLIFFQNLLIFSRCWYLYPQHWTFVQARRCQKSGFCKDFKEKTKPRLAFECWPRLVEEILDQSVRGCFLSSLKLRTNIVSRPRQVTHPPHSTVRAQLKQHSLAICTQHTAHRASFPCEGEEKRVVERIPSVSRRRHVNRSQVALMSTFDPLLSLFIHPCVGRLGNNPAWSLLENTTYMFTLPG